MKNSKMVASYIWILRCIDYKSTIRQLCTKGMVRCLKARVRYHLWSPFKPMLTDYDGSLFIRFQILRNKNNAICENIWPYIQYHFITAVCRFIVNFPCSWIEWECCRRETSDYLIPKVISVPCQELFDKQSEEYKNKVLKSENDTLLVSIEAGITDGWQKFTGRNGLNIGINTFGESGPGVDVANHFGITVDNLYQKIIDRMENK